MQKATQCVAGCKHGPYKHRSALPSEIGKYYQSAWCSCSSTGLFKKAGGARQHVQIRFGMLSLVLSVHSATKNKQCENKMQIIFQHKNFPIYSRSLWRECIFHIHGYIRGHSSVGAVAAAETGFEITRLQMLRNMFSLAIHCVQWYCVFHIFMHSLISV